MSSLGVVIIACVAFIFGALVGVLLISMCFSNERYDNSEASYDMGYEAGKNAARIEFQENFEATCSHCAYKGV